MKWRSRLAQSIQIRPGGMRGKFRSFWSRENPPATYDTDLSSNFYIHINNNQVFHLTPRCNYAKTWTNEPTTFTTLPFIFNIELAISSAVSFKQCSMRLEGDYKSDKSLHYSRNMHYLRVSALHLQYKSLSLSAPGLFTHIISYVGDMIDARATAHIS